MASGCMKVLISPETKENFISKNVVNQQKFYIVNVE